MTDEGRLDDYDVALHRVSLTKAPEKGKDHELAQFEALCEAVPQTIVADYFAASVTSPSALHAVRSNFTVQYALHCLLSYVFLVGDRTPDTILINRSSGSVHGLDFAPVFFADGKPQTLVDWPEPLPFRLTRAIEAFMTPVQLFGRFSLAMASAAQCFAKYDGYMQDYFRLLIRDVMLTCSTRTAAPAAETAAQSAAIRQAVEDNLETLMMRVKELRPVVSAVPVDAAARGPSQAGHAQTPGPLVVNERLHSLVQMASEPELQSKMPSHWRAWI